MQPLFAAALSPALTPDDIEVKLYDDRIEEISFDEYADLVAISIETFCAKWPYEIASEYKKREVLLLEDFIQLFYLTKLLNMLIRL
ncbi:MAG: hypothetical protein MZV63_57915 [Marinilabiliales bacterium]|nr:hypothetical protein [Marinilabiliales bacterium]